MPRVYSLRPSLRAALVAIVLISSLLASTIVTAQTVQAVDRVVAVINDDVIVETELQAQLRLVESQLRQSGRPAPPPGVLQQQVLERLVLERLQLQVAERLGLQVNDEDLNRAVANIAQRNNLSLEEFSKILARDGFAFGAFRENIRKEMLISRVRQRQIASRVQVRDREIDNYLESTEGRDEIPDEYRLRHILIAAEAAEQLEQIRPAAEQAMARLRAGEAFETVAQDVSDAGSAASGGDLGWRKQGQIPSVLEPAVVSMKPGEVSELIETDSGFHIVTVAEIRGASAGEVVVQTKARHILIQTNEITTSEDAQVRLGQLRERIEQGADFGQLARSHSDDRGSAAKNGDLGWVRPGSVVNEFQKAMDALQPGELSAPFRSQFGWHIVQVLERRDFDNSEEVKRSKAREAIRARKLDEELQTWLRELRDEAFVEFRLDE
jgi:peptidyl-prolyl cis-trans isomerase SurA